MEAEDEKNSGNITYGSYDAYSMCTSGTACVVR